MSEANNNSFEKIQFVVNSDSTNTSECSAKSKEDNKDKEIDWHKLAHKLREHNRKLLKKVFQLEQEIIESNKALEEHIKLARSKDVYVAKQAETINDYQEEIAKLSQKISTHLQEKSNHKSVVDNLHQKLKNSEENIAKLEKKCSEIKKSKDIQSRELLEKKQQIKELNIRFNRQQQHLLEYKTNKNKKVTSQPIKAWSAENIEKTTVKTSVPPKINDTDWFAPAATKAPINSIAAVQLPRFPRQAEGE